MTAQSFDFHDQAALLERISRGLKKRPKEVVFLVGAPLSCAVPPSQCGVPGVDGIIGLIRQEFEDDKEQVSALDSAIEKAGGNAYRAAFQFLQGRRGQPTANEIIRKAVLAARYDPPNQDLIDLNDDGFRRLEQDTSAWSLSPGMEDLGWLLVRYPDRFGKSILTTNFDPLIEVSIRRAGGQPYRTTLHADGDLTQTEADGCHVMHLHGYWYGSDTLHTNRQLVQLRPRLKDSLSQLLRNKLVVVCAYSGWDDAFTEALMGVVSDNTAFPEILWSFQSSRPVVGDQLSQRLAPGIDRSRVILYAGVDCNQLFPKLRQAWATLEPPPSPPSISVSNPVSVSAPLREEIERRQQEPTPQRITVLEGDNEDRPPVVDVFVGREDELEEIKGSGAKVVFLTGMGGQGKSSVAARYFSDALAGLSSYSTLIWRDCKEEMERFENQLAAIVEKLSVGKLSGEEIAKLDVQSLIELLIAVISNGRSLLIFDNVDHYVDLERDKLVGVPELLLNAILKSETHARIILTCRPTVTYENPLVLSQRLVGLSLKATENLFAARNAICSTSEIEEAHRITNGHAFWLDLLALQVVKRSPKITLAGLIEDIKSGTGSLPDDTLNSIWTTLRDREHVVLRSMAETVKPETEAQIGSYLSDEINYNQVMKALRALRALNLVVVKRRSGSTDLLELHPLVRQFVRTRFPREEQLSFIVAIIGVYQKFIGRNKSQLSSRPPISILEHWTQNAELDMEAGRLGEAFAILAEASDAFGASAYPREYCRVVRRLLDKIAWQGDFAKLEGFDTVFMTHVDILLYLGEYDEVDRLMEHLEETVIDRDARYIRFCGLQCHVKWLQGRFAEALKWAKEGKELTVSSGVDTQYSIDHALALALRDAGEPESALPIFLRGRKLPDVLAPSMPADALDGPFFGNIGRCLHFLGQFDSALICYQKSAISIERIPRNHHIRNQAYIRSWIGELLAARREYALAYVFYQAAHQKWSQVSPPKAAAMADLLADPKMQAFSRENRTDAEVDKIVLDWILGRRVDARVVSVDG